MSAYSHAYTAFERHIAAMSLKVSEQLTRTSPASLSVSDIDALEFSLEQNIRRPLRSLRNSKLLCNRIPPEIVTRIAHYCSSPTFDKTWYFCLLKSTHLCHRWREIITSCPSLWTLIHIQSPKIISIFLERSLDLPLDMYTLSNMCYEPAHLRRVRTLCLRTSSLHQLSDVFSRLTVPSPVIAEVIIDMTNLAFSGDFPDLPPLFDDTSTIQSLSLYHLFFNTKLLSFASLTSLNIGVPGELLPPFVHLFAVNPTLESISISVWGDIPTAEGQVSTPVIRLRNLVTLDCRDASMFLLSSLSLPPSTSILIKDTGFPLALSRTLPTSLTNIRCLAQIDSLRLTTTTSPNYSGQPMDEHSVQLTGSGGSVDIHWITGCSSPQTFDPHPLSLEHIKELSITHNTTFEHHRASELDLFLLFDAVKRLEVLRIHLFHSTDCDHILYPFYDDDYLCPFLHTVEVVQCSTQTEWLSSLFRMATRRREVGLALRKVLVSPYPDVDSHIQNYLKRFDSVLLESLEGDTM